MADFIFFMHDDAPAPEVGDWDAYLQALKDAGVFQGGSQIGAGVLARKGRGDAAASYPLVGYVRIEARDLAHAQSFLAGNPAYEAGATVEIRELPKG
jgi:hypothetical protein